MSFSVRPTSIFMTCVMCLRTAQTRFVGAVRVRAVGMASTDAHPQLQRALKAFAGCKDAAVFDSEDPTLVLKKVGVYPGFRDGFRPNFNRGKHRLAECFLSRPVADNGLLRASGI